MLLTIPYHQLSKEIREAYLTKKIKSFSIDYQYNSIMGYIDGEEVEVVNFDKIFKLDNRFSGYELYFGENQIVVEFTFN